MVCWGLGSFKGSQREKTAKSTEKARLLQEDNTTIRPGLDAAG